MSHENQALSFMFSMVRFKERPRAEVRDAPNPSFMLIKASCDYAPCLRALTGWEIQN